MRFKEFKLNPLTEAILDEVSMSPTSLQRWADSPDAQGMLMGIEFEMVIPNLSLIDDYEDEDENNDYSTDTRVDDIDSIINFFKESNLIDQYSGLIKRQYEKWVDVQVDNKVHFGYGSYLRKKLRSILRSDTPKRTKEEIEDIIYNENTVAYHNAYDRAIPLVRDKIRKVEERHLDENSWLIETGIDYMSEAAFRWGFDWPYKLDPNSIVRKVSITIDDVSKSFQKALGLTKVHTSRSYHGATREDGVWSIETDSSINGNYGDNGNGLEFISPAQPIAKTLEQMKQLVKWAKSEEYYTNETTGLHINISVPNFSDEKLDFIKLALFMGDKYILDQFKRTSNTYCRSATDIIKRKVTPENAEAVLAKMREHLNTAASKLIHSGTTDKYTSINTQDGYVEFRGPGGNYLDKPVEQLVNTSLRLAIALNIACDEQAHKEEYAKKLYKLIAPADSNNDTVKLFSMYAAGELHRNLLMYSVRQIQQIRKGIVPGQINIPLFDIFKPEYAQYLDTKGDWKISYPNGDVGHRFDVTPRMLAHQAGPLTPEGTSIQITLKGQDQPPAPTHSATINTPAPRTEAVSGDTADPLWRVYRDGYPQNYTLHHSPTAQTALAWASARTDMPESNFRADPHT